MTERSGINLFSVLIGLVCCVSGYSVLLSQSNNADDFVSTKPILMIVSYDGFRNEYLQRNVTPSLLKFRNNGVYTQHMLNVFPTKTFTNHHTIATGLYPDVHGVLANDLFDKKEGELKYGYKLFHYNSMLPIWSVNEKYGKGHSGCMMWPGSNFNYSGITCTHTEVYNNHMTLKERVDIVMRWMTDPEKPANLIMFYSEQPDKLSHDFGPDSQNITNMVAKLDKITQYIQDQLVAHNLLSRTNVIHLSDHGMAGVYPPKFINLTDYLEPDSVKFYGTSPVLQVVPTEGKEDSVYQQLEKASSESGHFDVFRSENLPKRWHASNQRRYGPIIVVAKLNYAFQDMWMVANDSRPTTQYGVHGYDNEEELMYPIFMAKGPSFKSGGQKVKPFETVDLFALFLELIGVTDRFGLTLEPSLMRNGTFSKISTVLRGFDELSDRNKDANLKSSSLKTIGIVLIGILTALTVTVYIAKYRKRLYRNLYRPTM